MSDNTVVQESMEEMNQPVITEDIDNIQKLDIHINTEEFIEVDTLNFLLNNEYCVIKTLKRLNPNLPNFNIKATKIYCSDKIIKVDIEDNKYINKIYINLVCSAQKKGKCFIDINIYIRPLLDNNNNNDIFCCPDLAIEITKNDSGDAGNQCYQRLEKFIHIINIYGIDCYNKMDKVLFINITKVNTTNSKPWEISKRLCNVLDIKFIAKRDEEIEYNTEGYKDLKDVENHINSTLDKNIESPLIGKVIKNFYKNYRLNNIKNFAKLSVDDKFKSINNIIDTWGQTAIEEWTNIIKTQSKERPQPNRIYVNEENKKVHISTNLMHNKNKPNSNISDPNTGFSVALLFAIMRLDPDYYIRFIDHNLKEKQLTSNEKFWHCIKKYSDKILFQSDNENNHIINWSRLNGEKIQEYCKIISPHDKEKFGSIFLHYDIINNEPNIIVIFHNHAGCEKSNIKDPFNGKYYDGGEKKIGIPDLITFEFGKTPLDKHKLNVWEAESSKNYKKGINQIKNDFPKWIEENIMKKLNLNEENTEIVYKLCLSGDHILNTNIPYDIKYYQ